MSLLKRVSWVTGMACAAALGALLIPMVAHSDEVVVGNLSITQTDNPPVVTTNKITLTATKPANVKAEPTYRGTPMYGVITGGTASNNKTVVVLDTFPNDTKPRLYVDVNGNGDLTDDTAILLAPLNPGGKAVTRPTGDVTGAPKHGTVPMAATVSNFVTRYDIKGVVREEKTPLQFMLVGKDLTYSPSIAHIGTLTIGDKTYKIALVDQNADGVFNQFTHEESAPSKVLILIDRNGDGRFDLKRESFDLAKPFRLAGASYEIANIDARGTIVGLKKTNKPTEGTITAEDLVVGGEVIEFAVKTVDGKMVHFPSDFKHKIVMLDFWAMWCGPCMAEMPNVSAVYSKYHEYGFEILGVSLDQANKFDTLVSFLPQNQMPWAQIYDGKYWNAEIAKLYGVDSIPRALLVDGDTGTILAMGNSLRGEGLTQQLDKALAKKHK